MGFTGAAAVIGAIVAVAGTTVSIVQGNKARADARAANQRTEQAANETRAQNAQEKANAARAQYREERVRRARIMQSANSTGTQDSSGELGALGTLSTAFSVNQEAISGGYQRGQTIGGLQQSAADSIFAAQQDQGKAVQGQQFASLGASLFNFGLNGMKTAAKVPGTVAQPAQG